jgi:hypothetical protein
MENPGPGGTNEVGTSVYGVLLDPNNPLGLAIPSREDQDGSTSAWRLPFLGITAGQTLLFRVATYETGESDEKLLTLTRDGYAYPYVQLPRAKKPFAVHIREVKVVAGPKTVVKGIVTHPSGKKPDNDPQSVYGLILQKNGQKVTVTKCTRITMTGHQWEVEFAGTDFGALAPPCMLRVRVRAEDAEGHDEVEKV